MPDITDIPSSYTLQQQLDLLNQAIAALQGGGNVNYMTVNPAPPPPNEGGAPSPIMQMPIRVNLDPPIDNPATISDLTDALQKQADGITKQLTDLGYTNEPPTPTPYPPGTSGTPRQP